MNFFGAERKIKREEAMRLVAEYLSKIGDFLDLEIKKGDHEYDATYITMNRGERIKTIGKIKYLKFDELLELALLSKGYNIINLYFITSKNFEGYILTYGLIENVSKSR